MYATLESLLAHYVWVASFDKAYAWARVQQLARDCPSLYAELPALLTEAMTVPATPSGPGSASASRAKQSAE